MTVSATGIALIQRFEGCRLVAYRDSVGVWTIGYGHTGPDVQPGMSIDAAQADSLLQADLAHATAAILSLVTVPLRQPQLDALASFVFNLGAKAFAGSTLLRKLNAGDYAGAAAEFPRWSNAGGQPVAGLLRRRIAERTLFLTPDTAAPAVNTSAGNTSAG
ncbi:lysozyme [Dyella tabacisoli]|uniref:Lysozyme n=2 Tax=Dyella tabacisoli TaxID=2282381 RepID=A0A369UP50_9GAMM|nr:lysozyme [Dyella tabacisoli]